MFVARFPSDMKAKFMLESNTMPNVRTISAILAGIHLLVLKGTISPTADPPIAAAIKYSSPCPRMSRNADGKVYARSAKNVASRGTAARTTVNPAHRRSFKGIFFMARRDSTRLIPSLSVLHKLTPCHASIYGVQIKTLPGGVFGISAVCDAALL